MEVEGHRCLRRQKWGIIVEETTGKGRRNTTPRKRCSSKIESINCA